MREGVREGLTFYGVSGECRQWQICIKTQAQQEVLVSQVMGKWWADEPSSIDLSILFQPVTINFDLFLLFSYRFAFKTLLEH